MTGTVQRLAGRLQVTEGQLYSATLTLVLAVLLATGLGNVHGVVGSALAQPPLAAAPGAALPPVAVPTAPTPAPAIGVPPDPALPPFETDGAPPAPPPGPAQGPTSPAAAPAPSPQPSPSPTADEPPCTAQPVADGGAELVRTLDDAAGGDLPDEDLIAAIGLITGCHPADPAVVALGLLIGIGRTLPDPGLPNPPPVPYIDLPDELVAALQPARPAIDEVCGVVGTGQTVASLFITAYPRPVPVTTATVLFQALTVCGQLRQP